MASRCGKVSPVAAARAAHPSASNAQEPAQLSNVPPFAVGALRCGVPSCWSTLTSPPFCLEKESLSQIWYLRPPWWQPVTAW